MKSLGCLVFYTFPGCFIFYSLIVSFKYWLLIVKAKKIAFLETYSAFNGSFFRMWFISIIFSSFPCALIIYCILLGSWFTHEIFIFHMYTNGNLLYFTLEASIPEVPLAWLFFKSTVSGCHSIFCKQSVNREKIVWFVCLSQKDVVDTLSLLEIHSLFRTVYVVCSMALLNVESSLFKVNFIVLGILNSVTFLLLFSVPLSEISALPRSKKIILSLVYLISNSSSSFHYYESTTIWPFFQELNIKYIISKLLKNGYFSSQ